MITLVALIAGSAASSLVDELNPVEPVPQADLALPDIAAVTSDLPIYPMRSPVALYLSELTRANQTVPVNGKVLDEYQIEQIDGSAITNTLSAEQIDTVDVANIPCTVATDDMVTEEIPVTGGNIELTPALPDPPSPIRMNPTPDDWPQGLLNEDNSTTYGDLNDWLHDVNRVYHEETLFRSILTLPFPSGESQLFPDHISPHPTYGWVLDNCLTDWINDRAMRVISPDPDNAIDASEVTDTHEVAQHDEVRQTFDQIYIPFMDKFEGQDDARTSEFFHKLYELLAPLRGLLVIAITGIDKPCGNGTIATGQKLSGLLTRSGFPAANMRVMSSGRHSYLMALRK